MNEQALIAAALLDGKAHLMTDVSHNDFEDQKLGLIWADMMKVTEVDVMALASAYGDEFLNSIISSVPSGVSIKQQAAKVKQAAYERRLEKALRQAADMVASKQRHSDVSSFVSRALDNAPKANEAHHISDVMVDVFHDIDRAYSGEIVNFVPTGMPDIDSRIGGLQQAGLIVVAGRPSMGKTAFAMNLARRVANSGPVLTCSMEMSAKQLCMRMMASETKFDLQNIMQGDISKGDDRNKLGSAMEQLKGVNIWINDITSRDVQSIAAEARRFKRQHGDMKLLVIDYLTLLSLPGNNRVTAIGEASRAFKVLAGEIGCPGVLLSQLSRKVEERADKRPMMSDLRESGAIEQDADQVIFPYRPEVYDQKPENEGKAEIIFAKNRNGRTGIVPMSWLGKSASFEDVATCDF